MVILMHIQNNTVTSVIQARSWLKQDYQMTQIIKDLVSAREKGLEALATAQETHSDKVVPVKLPTFAEKPKKSLSMAVKAKKIYEEESTVVRQLYFVEDLDEEKKTRIFFSSSYNRK